MGVWTFVRIRVSSELKGYSDWPGLEQVFEIRRGYQSKGEWRESIHYGVTSLPATIAIPERVLKLKRGHWGIESLHYVKDVTMREDQSTVHKDNGPKIMAALRNSVGRRASPCWMRIRLLLACAITAFILKRLCRSCLCLLLRMHKP
jgi:hypothetical protein